MMRTVTPEEAQNCLTYVSWANLIKTCKINWWTIVKFLVKEFISHFKSGSGLDREPGLELA